MSTLSTLRDSTQSALQNALTSIRKRAFGANNERLDFVMDSFYKLPPQQRSGVLVGIAGVVLLLLSLLLGLYFLQVGKLKDALAESFDANHELSTLRSEYQLEEKRFDSLLDLVQKKTTGVAVKPLFEKIANQQKVELEGITDQKVALPTDNPLAEKVEGVRVEFRLNKVSIPKMLRFFMEVEKSGHLLRVEELTVRERYGTKLFFDVQTKVFGYLPGKS